MPGQAVCAAVSGRGDVVIPSSSCVAMIRDQYPGLFEELGNEELRREFAALLPRVYELSEFLVDKLGVEDVGAYFPHQGDLPRELPRVARAAPGRPAVAADGQSARHGAGAAAESGSVLRVWRDVLGEECRGFVGDAGREAAGRCVDGGRVLHGSRQQLPDAPGRGDASAICGDEDDSHGGDTGQHARRSRRRRCNEPRCSDHPVLDPALAPPFPKAVLPVLRNPQLRKNVAHAIDVIQAKRARLVAEKTDWQELRAAGAAIRDACAGKSGHISRAV